jgi:hypothetical protein
MRADIEVGVEAPLNPKDSYRGLSDIDNNASAIRNIATIAGDIRLGLVPVLLNPLQAEAESGMKIIKVCIGR